MKAQKLLAALAIAFSLTACGQDNEIAAPEEEKGEVVYTRLKLQLPTGDNTKSNTTNEGNSDDGLEVGKDYENKVNTILVVLADKRDNSYIATSGVLDAAPVPGAKNTYTVPFTSKELETNKGKEVNIFVFCNPTQELKETDKRTWDVDAYHTLLSDADGNTIWNKENSNFLMSNAYNKDYSEVIPTNLRSYTNPGKAFNLGTIKVERSMARFDYKAKYVDNLYTLETESTASTTPKLQVQLTDMALINMSDAFYYLKHTSDAKDGYSDPTICGNETVNNWVVDTDAEAKAKFSSNAVPDNFFYPMDKKNEWVWTSIDAITGSEEDNDDSWNTPGEESKMGYHIWRYVTENAIPNIEKQQNGITTGIVFKGKIVIPASNTTLKTKIEQALKAGEAVYAFQNKLIGTWEDVKKAAEGAPASALGVAYNKAIKEDKENPPAAKYGFKGYGPNADKSAYELYYYYWNRHNDNDDKHEMGPMEFGVVRNNVYKLQVESIDQYGHPVDPVDPTNPDPTDPDPVEPDKPDEKEAYFKVSVEVLPWVVRLNHIEF